MKEHLHPPDLGCYVLDESFRVTLARPAAGSDPLAPFYTADSKIDALPDPVESAVRTLTDGWFGRRLPAWGCATVADLRVSVVPLHGPAGLHIGVFVENAA
jgi:hypothetical protein